MTNDCKRLWLFGVPLDAVSLEKAVDFILRHADPENRGDAPSLVTTVNTDFLANALPWFGSTPRNPELVRILRDADLSTADGMPLVWTARLLGARLPGRVTGADLAPALAAEAAQRGRSLYLFGGQEESAQAAAKELRRQNPELKISGVDSPFVSTKGISLATALTDDDSICRGINEANPDVLLIAFGNPKQELWFARNRHRLRVGVALGIGGTFDFISGRRSRAPEWMRVSGFEWLYRLLQEPRRLCQRYLVDFLKVGLRAGVAAAQFRGARLRRALRPRRRSPAPLPVTSFFSGPRAVHVFHLTEERLSGGEEYLPHRLAQTEPGGAVVLDCHRLGPLDAARTGTLVESWRRARESGWPVYLIHLGRSLRKSLRWSRAWDLLEPYHCRNGAAVVPRLRECWPEERGFVALDRHGSQLDVKLFGRLEAEDVAAMDVESLAAGFAERNCVIDLSLCTVMDSVGLGFLVRIQSACRQRNHTFHITGAGADILATIRAAELDTLLLSEDEAAES